MDFHGFSISTYVNLLWSDTVIHHPNHPSCDTCCVYAIFIRIQMWFLWTIFLSWLCMMWLVACFFITNISKWWSFLIACPEIPNCDTEITSCWRNPHHALVLFRLLSVSHLIFLASSIFLMFCSFSTRFNPYSRLTQAYPVQFMAHSARHGTSNLQQPTRAPQRYRATSPGLDMDGTTRWRGLWHWIYPTWLWLTVRHGL